MILLECFQKQISLLYFPLFFISEKHKKQTMVWWCGVLIRVRSSPEGWSGPRLAALGPTSTGLVHTVEVSAESNGLGRFPSASYAKPVFRDQTHVQHRRVNNDDEWNVLESDKSKQWKPVFCYIFLSFFQNYLFQKQNRLSEKLIHQHLRISGRRTHGNSRVSRARSSLSAIQLVEPLFPHHLSELCAVKRKYKYKCLVQRWGFNK